MAAIIIRVRIGTIRRKGKSLLLNRNNPSYDWFPEKISELIAVNVNHLMVYNVLPYSFNNGLSPCHQ